MHQLKADAPEMWEALLAVRSDVLNLSWGPKSALRRASARQGLGRCMLSPSRPGRWAARYHVQAVAVHDFYMTSRGRRGAMIHALQGAGGTADGLHFTDVGVKSWFP